MDWVCVLIILNWSSIVTGLHFTEALLQQLQAGPKRISPCYLTLHVVGTIC